jgi:predicted alpha-1,2-mannosidase
MPSLETPGAKEQGQIMTSKKSVVVTGASQRIGAAAVQAAAVLFSVIFVAIQLTLFAASGTATASTRGNDPAAGTVVDPSALVNQFIGTENEGWDIPAAGEPFGMVQEAPLVLNRPGARGNSCDSQSAARIYGFSQSTINACGFNYVPLMPTTGPVTSSNPSDYASSFTHAHEQAHPDFYQVLLDSGVRVDLTATTRTGWQQYTFPRTTQANVLFNVGARASGSEIHIVDDRTIEGWAQYSNHKAFFVAKLSRPFKAYGTWNGSKLTPGSHDSANPGRGLNGGWISFDTTQNDAPVVVKLGLSFTGIAGARKNLDVETSQFGFGFDAVQRVLHDKWNALLHQVAVTGGTHDQQVVFYTALYHSVLDPNIIGDVDRQYMGFDGKLRMATDFTPYSNLSLWDTFRTQNQLIEMLAPKVAHDIDLSILAIARQQGWLPRWFLGTREGNIMTGDPITSFLVEGWSKGLLSGDYAEEAYKYIRENATKVPPPNVPMNGRAGAEYFGRLGYMPYGLKVTSTANCSAEGSDSSCCPTHGNDNDCYYPVSSSLEYAAADASLALMAKGLGHADDAQMFAQRGQSYHNLFDKKIGFFRPRTLDGTWLSPYDTGTGNHAFHEGDPSQYQWLVPQDPTGLVKMMGGRKAATSRLDEFFDYSRLVVNPQSTAAHAWVSDPYDYYGPTTYDPDNEPNLLAPYMYAWVGRPDKTATVVRAAETLYTTAPGGMTGNDDMGEMSAWYVMSAIGLYPTMSGSNFYVVTTPLFPHTVLRIGDYENKQGGTLTISASGASMAKRYVASAKVNGKAWNRDWVGQSDIAHGGTIDYILSTSPTAWATAEEDAPPSVDSVASTVHQLGARLSPAQAVVEPSASSSSKQTLTLTLQATTPGTSQVHVTATLPPGWLVSKASTSVMVASYGLPTQIGIPLEITAPAGTRPGAYKVSITAGMLGAAPVQKQATISVQAPVSCAIETSTSCAVDLSGAYNEDGVATQSDPSQGNFDGGGNSYAADLLPPPGPATFGGVTYQAPATTGTDLNFVKANGQSLVLPTGRYSKLDIVGAASNGSTGSDGLTAVVTYQNGSTASVPLKFTGWTSSHPDLDNGVALRMPYRLGAEGESSAPVALYQTTLRLDPHQQLRAISLPFRSVPIWVAPGLTGIAWDHDSDLHIYAMTLQRALQAAPNGGKEAPQGGRAGKAQK